MTLLYCSSFMFREENHEMYGLPSCADSFFSKYLDVFDSIRVLGIPVKPYIEQSSLIRINDKRISIVITKDNTYPKDFRNDKVIKSVLYSEISSAVAVLIKPTSRKGMMAIKICETLHKPYMIEMTGDIHNALRQHPNLLKRIYAPLLYRKIKRSIYNSKFGLYVSAEYLQKQFPIIGLQCGCSDVEIDYPSRELIFKRTQKIDNMDVSKYVKIALIGFYQGKMKGIDTAIRAISRLPATYHLNILGNGTSKNRNRWYVYARRYGVENRIHFPEPLPDTKSVLHWLDTQDFFVLPTRSEGLARSCVEAMSRGCVCFATDICSLPELLPECCLHKLNDALTLSHLIYEYSTNKDMMKSIAVRNINKSKDYEYGILRTRRNNFLELFKQHCISINNNGTYK